MCIRDSNLGVALKSQGHLDEAAADFYEAIGIQPNFADGHVNLGIAFADKGRLTDALVEISEAVRLNPASSDAHLNRALVLKMLGRMSDSVSEYRQAIQIQDVYKRQAVIFTKQSGSPTNFSGSGDTFNTNGSGTAVYNGPIPTGSVHYSGNNVVYFPSGYTQVPDPSIQNLPSNLQSQSTLLALQGPNGNVAVQNALLGTIGGSDVTMFHGLGTYSLNVDLSKAILLNQEHNIRMTVRADAINILNSPIWGSPSYSINSTSFGQISSATGNRNIVLGARLDF